jgi:hypothetical protein
MVKIQIVTTIDLSKLYDFTEEKPKRASCELLNFILGYYNIKAKLVASTNPDIGKTIVCKGSEDVDIDSLLKDCEYIIELFDGYETAYACIE